MLYLIIMCVSGGVAVGHISTQVGVGDTRTQTIVFGDTDWYIELDQALWNTLQR